MATEFKLPDLGENITSADIVKVLVSEGDTVEKEQGVVEVETDKATVEVPCSFAGKVSKVHVGEGDTVEVGQVLISLEDAAGGKEEKPKKEKKPAKKKQEPEPEPEPEKEEKAAEQPEPEPKQEEKPAKKKKTAKAEKSAPPPPKAEAPAGDIAPASPSIRRLARELGVDLKTVTGSGKDGRITRDDVVAAVRAGSSAPAKPQPAPADQTHTPEGEPDEDQWGPVIRERMPKIRRTIASHMADSFTTIPHVTNFDDADVTELETVRKASKADYERSGVKLTSMPFIVKACAIALRHHPVVNAAVDMDAGEVTYKQYVNIGVAVDTDRGLIVPVLRHVDQMSFPDVARGLMNAAMSVRDNNFAIEDLRGGTFTISNLGAIGGTYSTPIINKPEVAILLVGRSRKLPVVTDDGTIEPRLIMPLSLSYDHRIVDGAAAARFLNEVIDLLESPSRLLLAP